MSVAIRDDVLPCPACGEEYLHHEKVEVWRRTHGEDQPGDMVTVDAHGLQPVTQVDAIDPAFAGRRGDVRISFRCEFCPAVSVLVVTQHKGMSLVCWAGR